MILILLSIRVCSNELYLFFVSNLPSWPVIIPSSLSSRCTSWAFGHLNWNLVSCYLQHYLFIHSHIHTRASMDQNTIYRRCNWCLTVFQKILPHFCNTHKAGCWSIRKPKALAAPSEYETVLKFVFLLHVKYRSWLLW